MKREFTTIKVWVDTRKSLRLIAASTGESMVEVIDRLALNEITHIQNPSSRAEQEMGPAFGYLAKVSVNRVPIN